MFTGIVEQAGKVLKCQKQGTNHSFLIYSQFPEVLYVDQSIAHDGACLTVTAFEKNIEGEQRYWVTAVEETLKKTTLGHWQEGETVNLERSLRVGQRMDGHFVQGHVDTFGDVLDVIEKGGSWDFKFKFNAKFAPWLVAKGSICVNGVSLTVVECGIDDFSVTIIPYTFSHTTFSNLQKGGKVNLEFDILGKYFARHQFLQPKGKTNAFV